MFIIGKVSPHFVPSVEYVKTIVDREIWEVSRKSTKEDMLRVSIQSG